jgi:ankyrin repeat protein
MSTGGTSSGISESSDDDSTSSSLINDHFRHAIESGDMATLREMIFSLQDAVGDLVVADDHIHEALFDATLSGSVEACRLLWGKLSWRGKRLYFAAHHSSCNAPLHEAASTGDLDIVRLFIKEFKWHINQKDSLHMTPLSRAEHLETARFLLENGANVNQGGEYGPLWYAVRQNNTEVSRLLLVEYEADPNLNRRRPGDEEVAGRQLPRQCHFARKCRDSTHVARAWRFC